MTLSQAHVLSFAAILGVLTCAAGWSGESDRVLLRDISVLTLYHGKMTNAGRSSPIPQAKCVGGSCQSFVPQVIQCYNRGSDGIDIQWECKTDMDNAYRFGKVEVSCEGYEYPDDPYVLRGSCGLEYTLDLTKEGHAQKDQGQHHDYYGNSQHGDSHSYKSKSSSFGDLLLLVVVVVVIYAIYKTCLSGPDTASARDSGDSQSRGSHRGPGSGPPPPGFRDEYMPGQGGCSSTYDSTYTAPGSGTYGANTRPAGGGFWSGAATGGLLGYMFGSRTNTGYGGYQRPQARTWGGGNTWGSGWGSGASSSWGSSAGSRSFSTGTRTASGFGGTKRR